MNTVSKVFGLLIMATLALQRPSRLFTLTLTLSLTRLVAEGMSKRLGVPVQVVNKLGGGGVVGFAEMTRAKPEGYTITT